MLSSFHALATLGYLISIALLITVSYFAVRYRVLPILRIGLPPKRFCRALPCVYVVLVFLVLLGSLLHAPTQYDGLCYRVPRMLHWWSELGWHWIHSNDDRFNISAENVEWITMPLLVFTRSDRWLWIPNFISFLLLPGLIFGTFRRLGVSPRASWAWMWLLPSGFCFVTQAGSIGNDLTAVPFALGSVYFALRARNGCYRDLALAILSAAMMTGIKASNIPLVLPAFVAGCSSLGLLLKRPLTSLAVLLVAVVVSFLPMALMNQIHEGDWTGDRNNGSKMRLVSPTAGLLGNGIMLSLGLMQPPILPSRGISKSLVEKIIGEQSLNSLKNAFPRFQYGMSELPVEEGAGLGIGVLLAFLFSIPMQFIAKRSTVTGHRALWFVLIAGYIALVVYMMKMGSESCSRLLMPYYPITLAGFWILLVRRQEVVRLLAWRWIAMISMGLALPVLILSPGRPLWPVQFILTHVTHVSHSTLERISDVYRTYGGRHSALAAVRSAIPSDCHVIGLAGDGGELETSLWWPLGETKIIHIVPGDTPEMLNEKGVQLICTTKRALNNVWHISLNEFCDRYHGRIIASPHATETVAWGEEEWFLIGTSATTQSPQG